MQWCYYDIISDICYYEYYDGWLVTPIIWTSHRLSRIDCSIRVYHYVIVLLESERFLAILKYYV